MTIVQLNQEAFFAVSDYITNSIQIPTLIKNMQSAVDYGSVKVLLRFFSLGRKVSLLSLVHKITTTSENNHSLGTFINGG